MKHAHHKRQAAYTLLQQHDLLEPTADGRQVLARRGMNLLKKLAELYDLELKDLPDDDPLLQGCQAVYDPYFPDDPDAGGQIFYRRDMSTQEQVFAVAHELAHFVLHRGQRLACHSYDMELHEAEVSGLGEGVEVYNPRNLCEREANLFALELLMPQNELAARFDKLASQSANRVERLAAHFEVKPYRVLMQLSNAVLDPMPPVTATSDPEQTPSLQLDDDQRAAIKTTTPALVLAGPGAGKTRTLVERLRHLAAGGANLQRVLVLTFSNKAAAELRDRLGQLSGAAGINVSTFHTYGLDFLRRYAERAHLARDFRLLDPAACYMLMEDLLVKMPGGYYISSSHPTMHFNALLGDFSRAKDYLKTPADYLAAAQAMAQGLTDGPIAAGRAEDGDKALERANLYALYEQEKQRRKGVDFGDLIMLPVRLLSEDKIVRSEEQARYDHILVDEFQDINFASGQLLQLLAAPAYGGRGNIWAVGDIHQSIYRFRGAWPRQAGPDEFRQTYAGSRPVKVLELSYNYRSRPPVVSLANFLRQRMPVEATRPLQASLADAPSPALFYNQYPTSDIEIATIAADIKSHLAAGHNYSDHALLVLTHAQADRAAQSLTQAGIAVSRLSQYFNRTEVQTALAALDLLAYNNPLSLLKLGLDKDTLIELRQMARTSGHTLRLVLQTTASSEKTARLGAMLVQLESRRSMWRFLAEYLFDWHIWQAGDNSEQLAARQSRAALAHLLRLAATFDNNEEDQLYRREEAKLGRALTPPERDELRRELRPAQQRRNFLRYRNALVQSRTRFSLGEAMTPDDNAVHILTAHTSKGLEFPFVYLPGWHLPKRRSHDYTKPTPPGLYDEPHSSAADDARSLFYVAATRAEQSLYLSYARLISHDDEGDEPSARSNKPYEAHPELAAALGHQESQPNLWSELLPVIVAKDAAIAESEDDEGGPAEPVSSDLAPLRVDYWELNQYQKCPRSYYYKYVLQGQGRLDSSKSGMYAGLQAARARLTDNSQPLPDRTALQTAYEEGWNKQTAEGKQGGRARPTVRDSETSESSLADYYFQQGQAMVDQLHYHAILTPTPSPSAEVSVAHYQAAEVNLQGVTLTFTIDRVESLPNSSHRLIRTELGPPITPDKLKTEDYRLLTLFALAYPNRPNSPPNQVIVERTSQDGVFECEAEDAYKKATEYHKWRDGTRKQASLLASLEKTAQKLRAGRFAPAANEHNCLPCPFYTTICPS